MFEVNMYCLVDLEWCLLVNPAIITFAIHDFIKFDRGHTVEISHQREGLQDRKLSSFDRLVRMIKLYLVYRYIISFKIDQI